MSVRYRYIIQFPHAFSRGFRVIVRSLKNGLYTTYIRLIKLISVSLILLWNLSDKRVEYVAPAEFSFLWFCAVTFKIGTSI